MSDVRTFKSPLIPTGRYRRNHGITVTAIPASRHVRPSGTISLDNIGATTESHSPRGEPFVVCLVYTMWSRQNLPVSADEIQVLEVLSLISQMRNKVVHISIIIQ